LFLGFIPGNAFAITNTASPTQYQLSVSVTGKSGMKYAVINGTAAASNIKVGDTIIIDVNGQYEFRDVTNVKTISGNTRTQLDFDYAFEYSHAAGAIVQKAYSESVVFDSTIKLAANTTAGNNQIQITDSNNRIKVGDTILINPNMEPISYSIEEGFPEDTMLIMDATSGLNAGDSLELVNGRGLKETIIVKSVDSSTNITVVNPLKYDYFPGTAYLYKIEKSQIIGIVNQSPKIFTLKNNLKYNHSINEPILLTNTAASIYEHDSGYSNNQNQGNQPEATLNPSVADPGSKVTGAITNGPHGKYTSNTNACGRCHQLHAAPSPKLVRFDISKSMNATNPIYATCTFCHTFNGQSTYDVKNGQIWDTYDGKRYATNGGGFERMLVVEGDPENATLVKVTSKHRVDTQAINNNGTYSFIKFNAPGGYGGDSNGHVELTCTKCHQPHGTRNGRQLVESVNTKDQNGNEITRNTYDGSIKSGAGNGSVIIKVENPFSDEKTKYSVEIVDFCGACHYDYAMGDGGKSGIYDQKYRHKMAMPANMGYNNKDTNDRSLNLGLNSTNMKKLILPTASVGAGGTDRKLICTTCHFAHGTFTTTEGVKQYDEMRLNNTTKLNTVGGWETSKNLRLDNRGVCQNCHNRQSDTVPPTLVDILNPNTDGNVVYGQNGSTISGQKAGSFTDDSIMIRFSQYMWTDPDQEMDRFDDNRNDTENPENYFVSKDGSELPVNSVKLQPDGRTVILYFNIGTITSGNYTVKLVNNGSADLNWNYADLTDPANTVTFLK
jgi:cytochrome c551/c552